MKITRKHRMTKQAAKSKVQGLLPKLIEQYGQRLPDPVREWHGDTMRFSFGSLGFTIKGTLDVTDSDVVLDLDLPFAAKLFEGTVRSSVERELDQML